MKSLRTIFAFSLALLAGYACKKDRDTAQTPGTVRLTFENQVNSQPLQLNTQQYTNPNGDAYRVTRFEYYISNVKLSNSRTGRVFQEPNSYHLIDAAQPTGEQSIDLTGVPAGEFDQLEFAIGVDQARNTSTDQVGDLDPSNYMAWDWNTGYKFLALEGYYDKNDQTQGALVFHIGSQDNYRILPYNLNNLGKDKINVRSDKTSEVTVTADVNGLFRAPNLISFGDTDNVMGGPAAGKIAANYATGLFSIGTIQNQ